MFPGTGFEVKRDPKYLEMEEKLAREMSKLKFDTDTKRVEVERI